jgi:hypothetical protein
VLKGDGSAYVGMLNNTYLILDKNYRIINTMVPEKGIQSTGLEIYPFSFGYARVKATFQYVISADGKIVPNISGKMILPSKSGFFIQDSLKAIHFKPIAGERIFLDTGYLSSYWLEDQPFYTIVASKRFSVFNEAGNKIYSNAKLIYPVPGQPFVSIQMPDGTFYFVDGSGNKLFEKQGVQDVVWGSFGVLLKLEKSQCYYSFLHRLAFDLKSGQEIQPFQKNRLIITDNGKIGFTDLNGNSLSPINYESGLDWNFNILFLGDKVYSTDNDTLTLLPLTRQQYNESQKFGKQFIVFKDGEYKLLNLQTGEMCPVSFDEITENWKGWKMLTNSPSNLNLLQQNLINGFVVYQNGRFSKRSFDLKTVVSQEMDTLIIQGFEPYRCQAITGKWGMVNSDLQVVCPAEFDKVSSLGVSRFKVSNSNKVGVVDANGKVLLPLEFDDVLMMQTHFYLAKKGKEVYVYDCFGSLLLNKAVKSADLHVEDQQLKLFYLSLDQQRQVKIIPYN